MNGWIWAAGDDGSSWYRAVLPSTALSWAGHRFPYCEVLPPSVADRAPIVVGSRVASDIASKAWQQMADRGAHLVLDLDDDYFNIQPDSAAAYAFWDPYRQRQLQRNIDLAATVTVASPGLAMAMTTRHPDVRVVPNALPAQYLSWPRRYDQSRPLVGWAGSASTVTELPLAERALRMIAARTDVKVVGAVPELTGLPGQHIEWIYGNERYLREVAAFDIWAAPYRDNPFNAAKFPTKALEAGFLGIPLVVSDIAPYREWAGGRRPEECGVWLIREPHEWTRALRTLVEEPELRARMGLAARSHAAAFALQGMGQRWAEAIGASE